MIKQILKSFVPKIILRILTEQKNNKQFEKWKREGCPLPPPHVVKQNTIKEYRSRYSSRILVETGTYLGAMVEAQKNAFEKVYSIELGMDLYKRAKKRFRNDKNVQIVQGDSGKVLSTVVAKIDSPAIFWLDGHYSSGITAKGDKECPIFEEIDAIFDTKNLNHVILIDDARCFTGKGDYPTVDELTKYIKSKNSNYKVDVKDDIIRYVI